MAETEVTIIVVPRERFSFVERSLPNIYNNTNVPFKLIYVTGAAPLPVRRYLERESEEKGFQFLNAEHYLSPNQARNLGLSKARTKYVVFLDNDALVTPGWLKSLIKCADETAASVVGPLYLIGELDRAIIHMAGGRLHIEEEEGKRILCDEQYLFDTPVSEATMRLRRQRCDYAEFHCMLVRTETLERVGLMDEKLLNLHEERDFCLSTLRVGGAVYIEPKAVVTYVPPPPCEWWDLPYFMLRWSETWTVPSVRHFNNKWDIARVRHVSDKGNVHEDGTVIGFGRAWRRRIAGVRVEAEKSGYLPESPLEQAELTVAMFLSVDREYFDLALTTDDGRVIECLSKLIPFDILRQLPRFLREADRYGLKVGVRPIDQGRSDEPALLRLDNLGAEDLSKIKHHAFLTLRTNPNEYQCWFAVDRKNWRSAAALAKWLPPANAQTNADGFIHLASSKSAGAQFAEGVAGLLTTARQLENSGIQPLLSLGRYF
jgi:GT2 family glycosyltransferase